MKIPVYETVLKQSGTLELDYDEINNGEEARQLLASYLKHKDRENVVVIMLDVRNKIIGIETVSIGTPMSSEFFLSSILKPALLSGAIKIIVGHNHPLGDATIPTDGDIDFTMALAGACDTLGIELLDNIIVDHQERSLSLLQLATMVTNFELTRTQ